MLQLLTAIQSWYATRDERGATAVEYGLMVSLIAVVIITAVALIGTNLDTMFRAVAGRVNTAIPG